MKKIPIIVINAMNSYIQDQNKHFLPEMLCIVVLAAAKRRIIAILGFYTRIYGQM